MTGRARRRRGRRFGVVLPLVVTLAIGCRPAPAALAVSARCESERGLRQRCTVRLSEGDRPLVGAAVRVTADMPSMPLAHHVPPAIGVPGSEPGTYVAVIEFEMPGRWLLGVRVAGPKPDYVTHVVDVR